MKTGGCFCGAVKFELRGPTTKVTYCHCSKCRKWHGHIGAFAAVDREHLVLTEERGLKWHTVSAEVRRGFCSECGSSLFFDTLGDAKLSFCAGSIDAPTELVSKAHIYVGSKGDYYELADDGLLRFDELP